MKGLFEARHFCYSCHKSFFTVKHLCAASGCMLCRQPGCLNRIGFISLSPMNITTTTTTTSSSQGNFQGKSFQFHSDRCRLKLRTEKCLNCHVSSGICHLYTLCPSCNNTVAKRALSKHICSKKRCTVCAVYYPIADRKLNSHKMAKHHCFVQKHINHNKAASVNSGVIHEFQSQNIDDGVMSDPQEFSFKEGAFPPACLFAILSMKRQQNIKKFLGWHTEQCKFYKQNLLTYNLEAELISYCKSDVKLLKEGFMEYRRLIQSVCSGIDPFEVACTAASACNFIYQQLFLPKDSIAILPPNGYTGVELTSFPAALWLCLIEQTARDKISGRTKLRYVSTNPGAV